MEVTFPARKPSALRKDWGALPRFTLRGRCALHASGCGSRVGPLRDTMLPHASPCSLSATHPCHRAGDGAGPACARSSSRRLDLPPSAGSLRVTPGFRPLCVCVHLCVCDCPNLGSLPCEDHPSPRLRVRALPRVCAAAPRGLQPRPRGHVLAQGSRMGPQTLRLESDGATSVGARGAAGCHRAERGPGRSFCRAVRRVHCVTGRGAEGC